MTHFRYRARVYKSLYRRRKWSRALYLGKLRCLKREYSLKKRAYARWHRIRHIWHETRWRTGHKLDLARRNRKSVKVYRHAVKRVNAMYKKAHRRYLYIMRVLVKKCWKRLAKAKKRPRRPIHSRPKRPYKKYTWKKSTHSHTRWGRTTYRTVFSKRLSSVTNYIMTIKVNRSKFSKHDQILINKCAKYF